jgi:ABC-type transport system involved in multi-copper enzyme maturation permease subunit
MLRVELARACSRRLVVYFLIGSIGAVVAITVGTAAKHSKEAPVAFEVPQLSPSPGSAPPGVAFGVRDRRFHYTDLRKPALADEPGGNGIVASTSAVLFVVGLLVGASLVGAEYRFGTVTTLLTWEPRRARVLLAKVLAVIVVVAAGYLLLEALLALALVPVAVTRGTMAGADAAFARGVAGEILRGAAIAGGLAGLGACLATLGRNTSAALGGLFVYLVVVEAILRAQRPSWIPWFLIENLAVVLTGTSATSDRITRSTVASGLLLAAYLAAAVALTATLFARRDVT